MIRVLSVLALVGGLGAAAGVAAAPAASAHPAVAKSTRFANCAALNRVYPHGVGKPGARDRGNKKPVTTFRVDAKLYAAQPRTLDRDKDGIACEKA